MLIDFRTLFEKYSFIPKGIVHCGASHGQEAKAYSDLGVDKVVWIEAIPSVYDLLIKNIEPYPNQIGINACIGDVDGEKVTFNVSNNEAQSSSYLPLGFHKQAHPSVSYISSFTTYTKTLKTILKENNIKIGKGWVLVADLQGSEMFALKGAGKLLDKFDCCYLEVNTKHVYEGCALKHEIEEYLSAYDFVPVEELIYENFGWGDEMFFKKSLCGKITSLILHL